LLLSTSVIYLRRYVLCVCKHCRYSCITAVPARTNTAPAAALTFTNSIFARITTYNAVDGPSSRCLYFNTSRSAGLVTRSYRGNFYPAVCNLGTRDTFQRGTP
jgi:hypothetical protein